MPDNNLPASAGSVDVPAPLPTEESLIEDLSELLDDSPATANPVEVPEEAAAPEEDDPYGLNETGAEDVAADTAEVDDESEPEIKGGRFAPDTAKVTLDDGTVTTIAELKRGTLFQRDYTKKTQELSKERETFDAERQQVSQYAQSLDKSREYLAWYAEQHLPKDPGPYRGAQDDYAGFIEWQQKQAAWAEHAQAYQTFQSQKTAEQQRVEFETQAQKKVRLQTEVDALKQSYPILKDPAKAPQFLEATARDANKYFGLTNDELRTTIEDRRLFKILRSAIERERLRETAPQAQAQVARKPAITSGRRTAPSAAQNREKQVRTERLRSDPSFENGVAALMDFDL